MQITKIGAEVTVRQEDGRVTAGRVVVPLTIGAMEPQAATGSNWVEEGADCRKQKTA